MQLNDAIKVLMISVDIHLSHVLQNDPTDEEFEAYFSEDGWGTAQANACRAVQKYLKRKGIGNSYG